MTLGGTVPEALMTAVATATVFSVMLAIGLGIVPREFRWVWQHRGLVAKGLFSVLIAVPALALVVATAFDLSRPVEIGIVLMAISPARRWRCAGQSARVAIARSPPHFRSSWRCWRSCRCRCRSRCSTWCTRGTRPSTWSRQVFTAQLLPLGLGILIRYAWPAVAAWLEPKLARIAAALLLLLAVLAVMDIWQVVVNAGPRIALAESRRSRLSP